MSEPLDAELRTAVKNGFLYLSLSKDWGSENWTAVYRTTGTSETQQVSGPDAVETMRKALRAGTRSEKAAKPPRRQIDDLA